MMIAVQSPGLVMVLLTVKIRPMAVTLLAMIMMAVTVKVVAPLVVALKTVQTVHMIGHLTDLNVAIQHGMNMALIVLH